MHPINQVGGPRLYSKHSGGGRQEHLELHCELETNLYYERRWMKINYYQGGVREEGGEGEREWERREGEIM